MLFWQAQMVKQQAQTKMTNDWLANMEEEEMELKTKVKTMEMYINNSAPSSIKELKVRKTGEIKETTLTLTFFNCCQHFVQNYFWLIQRAKQAFYMLRKLAYWKVTYILANSNWISFSFLSFCRQEQRSTPVSWKVYRYWLSFKKRALRLTISSSPNCRTW